MQPNGGGVDRSKTTAQQLGSIIKSARDIMRKDKGLSTDIDRLPLLTWIMFLKFLDDMERIEESKAAMRGESYRPAIEAPYRWRDWAAREDGITGPELLASSIRTMGSCPTDAAVRVCSPSCELCRAVTAQPVADGSSLRCSRTSRAAC